MTQSLVYPREIILQAINKGALSIILVHNHPSGDPTPSEADKIMTKKLVFSMAPIDISFLDHVIIGEGSKGYFSFYEDGLIDQYKQSFKRISEESERGF